MHTSSIRNWLDYLAYGWAGTGLIAGAIALLEPADIKFYVLSPIAGATCALAVSKRDDQHRQVPPSLAASPSRFAAQVEIALDNTLSQLQASERAADSLSRSVEQFSDAISTATAPKTSQSYLGKGFSE